MAHWSFTLEHAWIQHMQQHFWHIFPQQLDAAFAKTSAATGVAPIIPAGVFAAVAVRLPKPKPRFWSIILFSDLGSSVYIDKYTFFFLIGSGVPFVFSVPTSAMCVYSETIEFCTLIFAICSSSSLSSVNHAWAVSIMICWCANTLSRGMPSASCTFRSRDKLPMSTREPVTVRLSGNAPRYLPERISGLSDERSGS
nr:hypothetical protein Iba_chr09cCG4560 [Ipomoea batatas]